MTRIDRLTLPAPGFAPFTFPHYRPLLLGTGEPETTHERLATGAWMDDVPVGLAFYSLPSGEEKNRRLLSVMTSPLLRRNGLATRLLATGETLAREHGAKQLSAVHSSRMPALAAYEALLRRAGWEAPKEMEYRLAGKASWALKARDDWAPFLARLHGGGFGITPWSERTESDRAAIEHMLTTDMSEADRTFEPFKQIDELGPAAALELSMLLRRKNDVVGWIIAARGFLPDTYRYSAGYALPAVRRAGWLIGGVREVCERQATIFGGETLSIFETKPQNQGMRRFMERQLKPYSEWTDARYLTEKSLS